MKRKIYSRIRLLAVFLTIIAGANMAYGQKVKTKVVDNKGTIKWVLDTATSVIINAKNGITKSGDTVKLGGALTETTTIVTSASQFLQLTGLQSGSRSDSVMMVNNTTGQIKKMSVADLMSLYANNGLTKVADSIQLGGALTKPTTITTTATNTLALPGLQTGTTNDSVIVGDATTGVLRRMSLKNAVKAGNGLNKNGDTVKLGGTLTENTNITLGGNKSLTFTTSATDSIMIPSLKSGSLNTDSILVVNGTSGAVKRVSSSTLLNSGVTTFTTTAALETTITASGMPADVTRVWVSRNGANLVASVDYTTAANTVTLTPSGWSITAGDVYEVQWVK